MLSPICPGCQMHRVLFVQDITQHFIVEKIDDDGTVDTGTIEEEIPRDEFHFLCPSCGAVYANVEDLRNGKEELSNDDTN